MSQQYVSYRFLETYKDAYQYLPDTTLVAGYPEFSPYKTLGEYRAAMKPKTYTAQELVGWNN